MRVDEGRRMRVMLVARRVDRVVKVRIRCGRQSVQECQHRYSRTEMAQHDTSIVTAAYWACQASTAAKGPNARYNAGYD